MLAFYSLQLRDMWNGFKKESPAFKWLCIYLLFEYIRPQTLYPAIDILPYTQIALVLSVFYAINDRCIKFVFGSGGGVLIAYYVLVLITSALAFNPSTAFSKLDIITNWLIFYFLVVSVVNNEKRFFMFLLVFFLVNFKMSQFGFRSFISRGYSSFGVSGSPGWFKDSGDLGIEMVLFVPLVLGFIYALKGYWGRYMRIFMYMLPVTGVVTIIATTSRGAQLGLVAAAMWILLVNRKLKLVLLLLVAGALVYLILPDRMIAEFESAGDDSTSQARLIFWEFGRQVIENHSLLGVGYYNWIDYCNFMNPDGIAYYKHCLVAHNTYITAGAEIGIIGLMLYLLIILKIFLNNAKTRRHARRGNNKLLLYLSYGMDAGLFGYMVATIFFSVLFYPMLYVHLALSACCYNISRSAEAGASI